MYAQNTRNNADEGFKSSGYSPVEGVWQTLIVTGVATDQPNGIGETKFYVNGVQAGNTVSRVASGDTTCWIGWNGETGYPDYVAVAGHRNCRLARAFDV